MVGEIEPAFRAICLHVSESAVTITISHHGVLAAQVPDAVAEAVADVYADFPQLGGEGPPILVGFDRRDAPTPIPAIGVPIFALKGTQFLIQPDAES